MLSILGDNIYIILNMLGDNYLVDANKVSRNKVRVKEIKTSTRIDIRTSI